MRLSAYHWMFHRFALTPNRLRLRLSGPAARPVVVLSLPKAGTNLLERALCLHPNLYRRLSRTVNETNLDSKGGWGNVLESLRGGQVLITHVRHSEQRAAALRRSCASALLMLRDPRDVVISMMYFILKRSDHQQHHLLRNLATDRERLALLITGVADGTLINIGETLSGFSRWLADEHILPVRFEALVGPRGGGDARQQQEILHSIFWTVGVDSDPETIRRVQDNLFSDSSPTFRKGTIGQWRSVFDSDMIAVVSGR